VEEVICNRMEIALLNSTSNSSSRHFPPQLDTVLLKSTLPSSTRHCPPQVDTSLLKSTSDSSTQHCPPQVDNALLNSTSDSSTQHCPPQGYVLLYMIGISSSMVEGPFYRNRNSCLTQTLPSATGLASWEVTSTTSSERSSIQRI
jgi:hypothetical protein